MRALKFASEFVLLRQVKVTKKKATLAGSAPITAGRKLISLRLLELTESSTFGNSTAAMGAKAKINMKQS